MKTDSSRLKAKLLILTDAAEKVFPLEDALFETDIAIHSACSEQEAAQKISATDYAVVLADCKPADTNRIMRTFRAAEQTNSSTVPVIFILPFDSSLDCRNQGFREGAVDFIFKPVDPLMMRSKVIVFRDLYMQRKIIEEQDSRLKSTESTMLMQEKMASIGQLAAGIAHELNNPIGFVLSNFTSLQWSTNILIELLNQYRALSRTIEEEEKFRKEIEAIRKKEESSSIDFIIGDMRDLFDETQSGFDRTTEIINSMRDFAREDPLELMDTYDLNKGIKTTLIIARNTYNHVAKIETDLNDIPAVSAVSGQINQVLLNLIVNAAHAIEEQEREGNGLIKISTSSDDSHVYCTISDNGPGVPEEIREKVFAPFFTTKKEGKGTGLGLSICKEIITEKHSGELSCEAEPEGGTSFKIKIPIEPQ